MATQWSFDDLILNIKRRGAIPQAQMTYQLEDFKAMVNDEILGYALPILHSYREDYYVEKKNVEFDKPDKIIDDGNAWRLPDYAIANSLRDLVARATPGYRYSVPRLVLDDIPNLITFGWYFYGDYVVFRYDSSRQGPQPQSLDLVYHVRPNLICNEADAWTIEGIMPGSPTPDATSIQLSGTAFVPFDPYRFDIISGKSSFDVKGRNIAGVATSTNALSFQTSDLPADLKISDWFAPVNQTPFPMLPSEMHGLLAQRVAVKFLEEQGEETQLKNAIENMVDLEKKCMMLFAPRVEGKPKKLVNRVGLWRRWRW